VYSRNGKSSFSSSAKSEINCTFTIKDLQKLLEAKAQRQKNKATWKWSFMNPKEIIPPYYKPLNDADETLVFESRFESGNLDLAIKVSEDNYNLILQNDSLSYGHTQWFYFKVSNTRKGKHITFNILNFVLSSILQ